MDIDNGIFILSFKTDLQHAQQETAPQASFVLLLTKGVLLLKPPNHSYTPYKPTCGNEKVIKNWTQRTR